MKFSKFSIIGGIFILFAISACNKDKFETKPHIEIKSIGPDQWAFNNIFEAVLSFTDKEGDLTEFGEVLIQKQILNQNQIGLDQEFRELRYPFPEYPAGTQKGEILIRFGRNQDQPYPVWEVNPITAQNDTVVFHFAVRDEAGNWSDTVTSRQIIIIKN
ncbi:MAG TPA: hypothetical protein VIK74_07160 [Parasegetibacter sp.]